MGRLFEWGIFFVVLLVGLHYSIGLDEMKWWLWVAVAAIIVIVLIFDFVFDLGWNWLLEKIGLRSGKGPLAIHAAKEDAGLILSLTNEGKTRMKVAVIHGMDHRDKRVFALPLRSRESASDEEKKIILDISNIRVAGGETERITLSVPELESLHCRKLIILDSNVDEWPVQWHSTN